MESPQAQPAPQPAESPGSPDELTLLLAVLGAQRRHVLDALDGLDEEALRRPVLPSGWNCLGLVRHLTTDVERFWFRGVVAAEPEVTASVNTTPGDDSGWRAGPGDTAAGILAAYREEAARSDTLVAARTVTTPTAWWPGELFGDWRLHTLREIVLHVITETACHAGQLDAVRELLDGKQWLVLTE